MTGKNGKKKGLRAAAAIVLSLFLCLMLLLIAFGIYRMIGKGSLEDHAKAMQEEQQINMTVLMAQQSDEEQDVQELEEGQIAYRGKVYEYNDDLLTFLCLGVDSRQDIKKEKTPGKGGQADAILLAVMDQKAKTLKMINISRDTMTEIKKYDTNGLYLYEEETQLALQYAYGDGREKSCELMEQAVSNLFYGIPIHGYVAMDIRAVSQLNDAVGGVEVTVIEDLSRFTPDLALGNTLTLTGRQALHYVQERQVETEELGANNLRIERQKQYLLAFTYKVKAQTMKDITLLLDLYNIASRHMVTSITAGQVAYLSTIALECSIQPEDMVSIRGEVKKKDVYEEFYVYEGELYDLIIDIFYREVSK